MNCNDENEKNSNICQLQKCCKFLTYAEAEVFHLKEMHRFGVAKNHACASRRFAEFLHSIGKRDVSFAKMTPVLMADFERWMKSLGICRNTSSCYLRSLSAIWNKAVREGLASGNPFMGTFRGVARTKKRSVDTDTISRLQSLDIEAMLTDNRQKHVNKKLRQHINRLMRSRDLFLFSFCARGIAFVDMAYLKKSDVKGNTISYVRRKTGQRIDVQVEAMMSDILQRYQTDTPYLLPILTEEHDEQLMYRQYQNALHLYNKSLAELGKMLGVKLTSYVSRHSWATMARQHELPLSVISQALGHDSVHTTEIYLKSLDGNIIDKANHALLEQVFKKDKRRKNTGTFLYRNRSTSA